MKESVNIKERLRIVVKDTKTGKIIRDEIIYPRKGTKGLLDKILIALHLKKGSMQTIGREYVARLLGNVGTQRAIDRIGAYISSWNWKTAENSIITTDTTNDTLVVKNSNNPWTTAGAYTIIGCKNSAEGDANRHNSISINITIAAGQEWWAEIQFDID